VERFTYFAGCWGYVCTVRFIYYSFLNREPEKNWKILITEDIFRMFVILAWGMWCMVGLPD
jgi:hypothetical protein